MTSSKATAPLARPAPTERCGRIFRFYRVFLGFNEDVCSTVMTKEPTVTNQPNCFTQSFAANSGSWDLNLEIFVEKVTDGFLGRTHWCLWRSFFQESAGQIWPMELWSSQWLYQTSFTIVVTKKPGRTYHANPSNYVISAHRLTFLSFEACVSSNTEQLGDSEAPCLFCSLKEWTSLASGVDWWVWWNTERLYRPKILDDTVLVC